MKWLMVLLTCLALLILAVATAPLFKNDPGYVLIRFHNWSAETSVLVLLLGLIALYALIRLVFWLWAMPARTLRRSQAVRAQKQLERGLLALTEGDWRGAEKALQKSGNQKGQETVKYLAAARAAQGQESEQRRDEYLSMADTGGSKKRFLVDLSRAKLLVSNGDVGTAIPLLESLQQKRKKHPQVLELLARCYREIGDWRRARQLIPVLRKAGLVDSTEASRLEDLAAVQELTDSADIQQLQQRWRKLPRVNKKNPDLVEVFADRAIALGDVTSVEPVLRGALKTNWDQNLIKLYARHSKNDLKQRIKHCEKWLKNYPQDAGLQLTLGRLCAAEKLWGKAREHLASSLQLEPSVDGFQALGALLEKHGEIEPAMLCFRNALHIASGEPPLPLPQASLRIGQGTESDRNGQESLAPANPKLPGPADDGRES